MIVARHALLKYVLLLFDHSSREVLRSICQNLFRSQPKNERKITLFQNLRYAYKLHQWLTSASLLSWQAQPWMAQRPNQGQDAPLREER